LDESAHTAEVSWEYKMPWFALWGGSIAVLQNGDMEIDSNTELTAFPAYTRQSSGRDFAEEPVLAKAQGQDGILFDVGVGARTLEGLPSAWLVPKSNRGNIGH
jgi:hypothetical protein